MEPATFPATLDSLAAIRRWVGAAASEAGLDAGASHRLKLAVDEVATNVILHGYQEAGLEGDLDVSAKVEGDALEVRLEDAAIPFDPTTAAPPADLDLPAEERSIGGLGVYLARREVDRLEYERVGGRNRNTFVMRRPRGAPPPPAGASPAELESWRMRDRLHTVISLGVALSGEKNLDRLLDHILAEAKAICCADAGTLYVREGDRLDFAICTTDSLGVHAGGVTRRAGTFPPVPLVDPETGEPNLRNVAARAAVERRSINVDDIDRAAGFDFSGTKAFDARTGYRSISMLTVPLESHEGDVIGVVQLINAQDAATGRIVPFGPELQEVVEALASLAAAALNDHLLRERQKSLLAYERDLQIGRQIQSDFLPEEVPRLPGWELAARFQPAREVAGDFYDAFPVGDGQIALVLGDVCDKGVGAALFMAIIRSMIRAFAQESCGAWNRDLRLGLDRHGGSGARRALKTAVELTNEYLVANHGRASMFATVFFATLDPATGAVLYGNCGHEPPIVLGPDGVKARLQPTGPAIGVLPCNDLPVRELSLEPGHTLLAYTDGVTEARDPEQRFFTEARLLALLGEPATAAALLERIQRSLAAHVATAAWFDDVTMLAVRRSPR
jgi:sigma-B regulation protein RsbU (phosphoserine phosphatase)